MTRTSRGNTNRPVQSDAPHAMTLRLDRPLADRLNFAALVVEEPVSDIIRAALRTHLRRIETDPTYAARYAELRKALTPEPTERTP